MIWPGTDVVSTVPVIPPGSAPAIARLSPGFAFVRVIVAKVRLPPPELVTTASVSAIGTAGPFSV